MKVKLFVFRDSFVCTHGSMVSLIEAEINIFLLGKKWISALQSTSGSKEDRETTITIFYEEIPRPVDPPQLFS